MSYEITITLALVFAVLMGGAYVIPPTDWGGQ